MSDTITAIATAPGQGGIAISMERIRLRPCYYLRN